jgi:uncharacterized protein YndB with AHSA1/START domain
MERLAVWEFEYSVQVHTSRERVWELWIDVTRWPSWNPGIGRVQLEGPVSEGATGTIRALGGPTSTFKVLTVERGQRLVTEASQRLVRLRFEHELADLNDGRLLVTHRVRMTGPATPLLRHTIGARLKRTIPAALDALVERTTAVPPTRTG